MVKIAFKIAYIGTDFYGFQRQPNLPTIEGELLKAFDKADIMDNPYKSNYSIAGRTDRGVHSLGNVISFNTNSNITINQINYYLPATIQIIGKTEVPQEFKPRFAEYRHYKYIFTIDPFNEKMWDLQLMKDTAERLKGTHNFHNFSKKSERTPIRNIKEINIKQNGHLIVIDVIGESFLWNMVRKIITIITMIGKKEMEYNQIDQLLDPDIYIPITPAPPEGLILMDVKYHNIKFTYDKYAKNNFYKTLKNEYIHRNTIAAAEKEMMNTLKTLQKKI